MLVVTKNGSLEASELLDSNAYFFVFDKNGQVTVVKRDEIVSVACPTEAMLEAMGLDRASNIIEEILVHAETYFPGKYAKKDLKGQPEKVKALAHDLKNSEMTPREKEAIKELFMSLKKVL